MARAAGGPINVAEESDSFELDSLTLVLIVVAAILTFYLGPFWDTFQSIAFKGNLLGVFLAIGIGIILMLQVLAGGFSFNKSVNLRAVGLGIMGIIPLMLIEVVVFAFLPPNARLLSVAPLVPAASSGLQPNLSLGVAFYDTAAIDESIAMQGGVYTLLVSLVSDYSDDHSAFEVVVAASTVGAIAFLMHFAAYGETASSLAVAIGFFTMCIFYELSRSLNVAILMHLGLNTFSTLFLGFSATVI
jgi:hypothetical protein